MNKEVEEVLEEHSWYRYDEMHTTNRESGKLSVYSSWFKSGYEVLVGEDNFLILDYKKGKDFVGMEKEKFISKIRSIGIGGLWLNGKRGVIVGYIIRPDGTKDNVVSMSVGGLIVGEKSFEGNLNDLLENLSDELGEIKFVVTGMGEEHAIIK